MGLRNKIRNKVNKIFGRESSPTEHPLENDILPDVPTAPGRPLRVAVHTSRPYSSGDVSGRGIQIARAENTDRIDNSVAASDGERVISSAENATADNRLGAVEPLHQPNMKKQYVKGHRDIDGVEDPEIRGVNPDSDIHNHRTGTDDAKDGKVLVLSGRPLLDHFTSESGIIHGVTNSGISIGGGTVNVNNVTGNLNQNNNMIRPGLEILEKRFAGSAFHNSFQRIDPPRCHPDTRVAIQKQIYDWILTDLLVRQAWILWMHGAAGAGKSAIMQSIAELCEKESIPLASFFFVRTDSTRNSIVSFIATLVYQLIQILPQTQDEIFGIIESNPRIFDLSLESQLHKLFIQPLLRVQKYFEGFFVVFIDGLDECIERARQSELINLLGTVSRSRIHVIFLVASRREPQIEAAFVRKHVHEILHIIPLDNSDVEQTSEDIRHFLVDKFSDIKETHLLKHQLPADWPAASVVEEIVAKSSGQFIFASIVINYLSSPRANPAHQLEVIRGIRLRGPSSQNPFAHLDALYQHIFSQVEELGTVSDILALYLLVDYKQISTFETLFLLEKGELYVLFTDLTAVILCEPHTKVDPVLKFLHASLPDFLLDKSRSGRYHIDLNEYRTKLLCRFLEMRRPILDPLQAGDNLQHEIDREHRRLYAIEMLLDKAKASERLHSALMNFNSTFYSRTYFDDGYYHGASIVRCLKQLDFSDRGEAYRHVKDVFAAEYAKYWSSLDNATKKRVKEESPDLIVRINQIL